MSGRAEHCWGARGALLIEGRPVHYRRRGHGRPAILLLHGSPESASALHPVVKALAPHHDLIGIDTPGNGLSAPLPTADPTSEDYARHALAVLDAFGVERAGLYGFHTGAGTAMTAAMLAPERVTALALDGYAVWTDVERAELLARYCVVYPPVEDGSHLKKIWRRLEDQRVFFPWYDQREEARLEFVPLSFEVRLRRLRDWLTAWESYVDPYRAAFTRRGEDGPDRVACPTLIGAMAGDPLAEHLDRLTLLSDQVQIRRWGADRAAALNDIARHLSAYPGSTTWGLVEDSPSLENLTPSCPSIGLTPDEDGDFLLELWDELGEDGLDPLTRHARVTGAIQSWTGL